MDTRTLKLNGNQIPDLAQVPCTAKLITLRSGKRHSNSGRAGGRVHTACDALKVTNILLIVSLPPCAGLFEFPPSREAQSP